MGINARGLKMTPKTNPANGYLLTGMIRRVALMDLMNNFHVYVTKQNKVAVISPGRERVSQKEL